MGLLTDWEPLACLVISAVPQRLLALGICADSDSSGGPTGTCSSELHQSSVFIIGADLL